MTDIAIWTSTKSLEELLDDIGNNSKVNEYRSWYTLKQHL